MGSGALVAEMGVLAFLSASHMTLPNHWLPYSVVGRAQRWSMSKTIGITIAGCAGHVVCTMAFAIAIASVGGVFLSERMYRFISSGLIFGLGVYYLASAYFGKKHTCCDGKHSPVVDPLLPTHEDAMNSDGGRDRAAVFEPSADSFRLEGPTAALSVVALTTLSPCLASMPVLIAIVEDTSKIFIATLVLFVTSVGVMCPLVAASYMGAARIDLPFVRQNERKIMGWSLVVLSVLTFLVFANHHHNHSHADPSANGHG